MSRILIVEAHDYLREAMRNWLKMKFPDYQLIEATGGEDAIAIIQTTPVSVVIIDISLPGINGGETVTRIKAIAPATRILVLSTFEDEIYQTYTTTNGADAFLHKAKMLTEFEPTLKALLSSENVPDPRKIDHSFG